MSVVCRRLDLRTVFALGLVFLSLLRAHTAIAQTFPSDPNALTHDDVEGMVRALRSDLLSRHQAGRHWEPAILPEGNTRQEGGRTALVALALLDAGTPVQEPRLLSAIQQLARSNITGSYARAACLMIYARLPDKYLEVAYADVQGLMKAFGREDGGWGYYEKPLASTIDNSIVQFCILGLSEIADRGVKVPKGIFEAVRNRYLRLQGPNGGWGYKNPDPPSGSMTAAGLATLTLCNKHAPPNKAVRAATDNAIRGAIQWLNAHFNPTNNPGKPGWTNYYWLFSAERAGQATAVPDFGGQNWLCEGAATIARNMLQKNKDGTWSVKGGAYPPSNEDEAFALLFLARAQKSIAIGLHVEENEQIDPVGLNPAAIAVGQKIERPVDWLRLTLNHPLETWSRAPIVLLQGSLPPAWAEESIEPDATPLTARLLAYAKQGGTVIFAPSGKGRNFVHAVRGWGERALPGRTWQRLSEQESGESEAWKRGALSIGTPTRNWFILLESLDPKASYAKGGRRQDKATEALLGCWELVTNGKPWTRRPTIAESPAPSANTVTGGQLLLVRHDGEWNSEPLAAPRASQWLRSSTGRDLWYQDVPVEILSSTGKGGDVAWIRGITSEEADNIDVEVLKTWTQRGGRLLIETSGGRGDFATTLGLKLAAACEGTLVPATRPESLQKNAKWSEEILAVKKGDELLAIVCNADCSVCMLAPRTVAGGRGVGIESTTAMLAILSDIKKNSGS